MDSLDDFLYACRVGDLEDVRTLYQESYKVDDDGNTGLHFASANGHFDVVQHILDNCEFDINKSNSTGNTPLHWAAFNGNLSIIELLLAKGASPDIKNQLGRSASTLAEQQGHHDCVNKLLAHMNTRDEEEDGDEYHNGVQLDTKERTMDKEE